MADKEYKHPSGVRFEGKIGRTIAESKPWWEPVPYAKDKPDIVLVVLDDAGFSHFGCYGSTISTPNIDQLAMDGACYSGFHTTALCSPTRACLLTGRNHHAVGMRAISNVNSGFPNMRGGLPLAAATLPAILREEGYATFATGKWHIAPMAECSAAGPFRNWPLQKGFDRFYGFLQGETDHFYPELVADNHFITPPGGPDEGYHFSEDMIDQSIGMLRDSISLVPEKPFFLYAAFGAVHSPHHAPQEWLQKYRGRFDHGWDEEREHWYQRQLEKGVIPSGTKLVPPNPGVDDFQSLPEDNKRFANRLQEAFSAMMDHTDAQIGRLVEFLRSVGRLDNTIFVVMSDNGASREGGPTGVMDEMRFFNGMQEDMEEAIARMDSIGGPHSHSNIPWGWAQAGNTPLRWYKSHTHGGGVRDPLIVHWPAGTAENGKFRRQFCHAVDIAPTLLDAAGIAQPKEFQGVAQMPVHGNTLLPTLKDAQASLARGPQYFEMTGHRGIWHDGWKAVTLHRAEESYEDEPWELYNLEQDFSEHDNLAQAEPQRLKELKQMWWDEAEKHGVLPLDDRRNATLFRTSRQPGMPTARDRFVFYPPLSRIVSDASPPLIRGWTCDIHLRCPARASGALMARGTSNSGLALYMQDGQLFFVYNCFHKNTWMKSSQPVPEGEHKIQIKVVRRGQSGDASMLVDGQEIASVTIPRLLAVISSTGMDIGRSLAPITDDYKAPFTFEGEIDKVIFELPPRKNMTEADKQEEAEHAARAEDARQ